MSVESFSQDTYQAPADTDVHAADTDQFSGAQEQPADDPLQEYAERYQLDRFKDVGSALDMFAAVGATPQQPQQYGQPQGAPASFDPTEDYDDDFDFGDVEEEDAARPQEPGKKVRKTKREKALEKQLAQRDKQMRDLQQQQQQFANEQLQQLEREVLGVVDSLSSDTYGVGMNRTHAQLGATRALVADAIRVSQGSQQFGTFIPLPDAIKMIAARQGQAKRSQNAQPEQPGEVVGLEPRGMNGRQQGGNAYVPGPPLPGGGLSSYARDPQYASAVNELLRRG